MNKSELNSLATQSDIIEAGKQIISNLTNVIRQSKIKEFYTPKEFSELTGLKYSTVVNYCNIGRLEATQLNAQGSWIIYRSEVDKLIQLAQDNKPW